MPCTVIFRLVLARTGSRQAPQNWRIFFTEGEPDKDPRPSVLGRRSYIDDILILAKTWSSLYEKVERLLELCDKWNLSISLTKSFWGCQKVDYLGHQVSLAGLEAHPKDLGSLVNIPFPRTLSSMQSFRKPELLQSLHPRLCDLRISIIRVERSRFLWDLTSTLFGWISTQGEERTGSR